MELKTLLLYVPMTYPTLSTRFFKSFLDLVSPVQLAHYREKYGLEIKTLVSNTFPLDRNRNEAADLAMSNKYNADYLMFIDGDNILPKSAISDLMDAISEEHPVVSGLYWRKGPPFTCVQGLYAPNARHEKKMETIKNMGFVDETGQQLLYYSPLKDFDTIRPIDVSGMGCLLVKTDVFKRIELPYFGYFNSYSLGGDFTIESVSEEMLFFCKLRKNGIKTLLVPSVRCGHEVLRVIGCMEE